MTLDLVNLTQELIDIKSVSRWSNVQISNHLDKCFREQNFQTERLEYVDENGESKVSIVGKKGTGTGGLAFFSHTDTVPGQEEDWEPYRSIVRDGRVFGRGACDMKGPLAASIVAAADLHPDQLKSPVYVMATADEEVGGGGAQQVARESRFFREGKPRYAVVAEPTEMVPIYAHKGGATITITALGKAAHTSTDLGISANFLIAPFLAEMAELSKEVSQDPRFQNFEFNPPSNGFNMVFNDGGTRQNVTAAKSVCEICFRPMPGDKSTELVDIITRKAERYGLKVKSRLKDSFHVPPTSSLVQLASRVAGGKTPATVPFGTDAGWIQNGVDELVVLGPGNIAQAHTVGEWVSITQLEQAVAVYRQLIQEVCS